MKVGAGTFFLFLTFFGLRAAYLFLFLARDSLRAADFLFSFENKNKKGHEGGLREHAAVSESHLINFTWPYVHFY